MKGLIAYVKHDDGLQVSYFLCVHSFKFPFSFQNANYFIFKTDYSLPRAKARLEEARNQQNIPENISTAKRHELTKKLQQSTIQYSQVGDNRPLSYVQFSPNSKLLATASW